MRRPLCLLCLLYVFLIMFCMKFLLQKPEERLDNNQNNRFCGKVYRMEVKNNHPVIYLKNAQEDSSVICYLSEKSENTSQNLSEKGSDYFQGGTSDYHSKYPSGESIGKKLKIGNTVVVQGKVRQFESATNDGQFDMKEYYAVMGIDFSMTGCSYEVISETYWPVRHGLYVIKNSLSNVLDTSLSKEDAGVLKAMLFGDKSGMDDEIKGLYQRNGIAHIIAVSGVNTLNLVSLSKSQMPNLRASPQVLLRKFTLFYQQILSGFCPLVVLPLFRGCFSKLTKWQKEYLFAKV